VAPDAVDEGQSRQVEEDGSADNGDDLLQVATAKLAGGEIELTSEADDRVIAAELDEDRELEVEQ
jgi:hypothetical protein